LSNAIENAPVSVVITNKDVIIEYVNPGFEKLTLYQKEEALGKTHRILQSGLHPKEFYDELWDSLIQGKNWTCIFQNKKKNGDIYWAQESIAPVKNDAQELTHYVSIQEDVTSARELTDKLQHLAVHDTITGLYNRYEFEKRLSFALKYSSNASAQSIMCYLDLDQFKIVNDTSGHMAGDELLKQISFIMQQHVDEKDIVARLGGDEFGILFIGNTIKEAKKKAEAILKAIKEHRFAWEDKVFVVGASIGMVPITRGCCSLVDIISAADEACYQAKEKGRNCIYITSKDDKQLQEKRSEMQWLGRLTQALEEEKFVLYIQPIVSLKHKSSAFKHYEILIRLKEGKKIISPMAFIPAAERYGMMQRIDKWVIETVFKNYMSLQETNNQLYRFSINLSGISLNDRGLTAYIEELFKRYHVPHNAICFEVTETAAVANLSIALKFIDRMHSLGCRFSLDDFGSGLSSFAYLQNIPVDYLKIDGTFVIDIHTNKINKAMVKSINEISHTMGMKTICEYVENIEIENVLKEMGVDNAQGYFYGKPEPIERLIKGA